MASLYTGHTLVSLVLSLLFFHPHESSLSSSREKESWPKNSKAMSQVGYMHLNSWNSFSCYWYRLALNYLGSYVANNGKAQLLTIEVLTKIMKQPRLLRWKMLTTEVIELNIETTAWRTLTTVFSVLSKYGFQPMLITILYTPCVESPAQPKYTPDVCSDTTSEKFSAGKLATV